MRITDVLRRKGDLVVTIRPDDTVRALLDALAEHRVGALVVVPAPRARSRASSASATSSGTCRPAGAGVLEEPVERDHDLAGAHRGARDHPRRAHGAHDASGGSGTSPSSSTSGCAGIVSIGDVVKHRIEELQSERDQLTAYIQQ